MKKVRPDSTPTKSNEEVPLEDEVPRDGRDLPMQKEVAEAEQIAEAKKKQESEEDGGRRDGLGSPSEHDGYEKLVDQLDIIYSSAPGDVDPEGWTELVLSLAGRIGSYGLLKKKHAGLTNAAERIAWKEENSAEHVLTFDPQYYKDTNNNLRRGDTEVQIGVSGVEAAEICKRKGIDPRAVSGVAKAKKKAQPQEPLSAKFSKTGLGKGKV